MPVRYNYQDTKGQRPSGSGESMPAMYPPEYAATTGSGPAAADEPEPRLDYSIRASVVANLGYSAHDLRVSQSLPEVRKRPQDARFSPHPLGAGLRRRFRMSTTLSVKILTNRGWR